MVKRVSSIDGGGFWDVGFLKDNPYRESEAEEEEEEEKGEVSVVVVMVLAPYYFLFTLLSVKTGKQTSFLPAFEMEKKGEA
uniref:Uncharacterized protein n=1 Tax=Cucumis melo TaxID=3656 RepID=A0A9I9EED1_CUCME